MMRVSLGGVAMRTVRIPTAGRLTWTIWDLYGTICMMIEQEEQRRRRRCGGLTD